jgi:superfamily II DNA/RNA helicase
LNNPTSAGAEAGPLEVIPSEASITSSETTEIVEAISAPAEAPPSPPDNSGNNSVAEAAPEPQLSFHMSDLEKPTGFDSLDLSPELRRAVAEAGYVTPTPIQAQGIPHVLKGRDIIGIAQTGTGKTASFTLPMIELLARGRAKARMPRTLILEPTRELAAQVAESFEKYGKYNKLSMALLIGGVSFDDQNKKLDRGVDVLIATPGRMLDHFERGRLMLSQVQILVIDEADRMLDMGFIPDVERICKLIPFTRQTLFYSATMPPEIQRLTDQFLSNPVRVEVARPASTADNIKQEIVEVPGDEWAKREALRTLVREAGEITNAIVFCNKKRTVDIVAKSLSKHGFNAAPLHGDLDQSVRTKTLEGFRSGEVTILVASDVAARGLDIPAVSHIFNFDVPYHPDDYVHRIGRTGRAGRDGKAYMLVSQSDGKYVDAIEKLTKSPIPHRTMEGLAERVRERPPREKGPRDDRRGRRNSHDRHSHPVKPHGQVAAMEPVKNPLPAETETRPDTRAERLPEPVRKSGRRPAASRKPVPKAEPVHYAQAMKPRTPPAPQDEAQAFDAQQLPAFLLRPVKLPKAPERKPRTKKKDEADS